MGKGSRRRPTNEKAFRENHERVFGVREIKTWNPELGIGVNIQDNLAAKIERAMLVDSELSAARCRTE